MRNLLNDTRYRAAYLGGLLARHYPHATPHSVARLVFQMQNATRAAVKFATDQCNYDLGDPDDSRSSYARRRRAEDRKEAAINATLAHPQLIAEEHRHAHDAFTPVAQPATVVLGGDPRGPCGRLVVPGVPGDGWGDGFAIY